MSIACALSHELDEKKPPILLLVSCDGFTWNTLDTLPNLNYLKNISNIFSEDFLHNASSSGEPIWVTNERAGKGRKSTVQLYDKNLSENQLIKEFLTCFSRPQTPANLGALLLNESDLSSDNTSNKIDILDHFLGGLIDQLKTRDLFNQINIVITLNGVLANLDGDTNTTLSHSNLIARGPNVQKNLTSNDIHAFMCNILAISNGSLIEIVERDLTIYIAVSIAPVILATLAAIFLCYMNVQTDKTGKGCANYKMLSTSEELNNEFSDSDSLESEIFSQL